MKRRGIKVREMGTCGDKVVAQFDAVDTGGVAGDVCADLADDVAL